MVASMDSHVGRIIQALDDLSLREKTLVFFSTDNGTPKRYIARADGDALVRLPVVSQQFGQAVPGGKGDLTDLGTRVPTIASWPGTVPAGRTSDALIDFTDLLPTFSELAGNTSRVRGTPGHSFSVALRNPRSNGRDWIFAERGKQYWFRTQRWKLYSDGRFFDMQNDPGEIHPLPEEGLSRRAAVQRNHLADTARTIVTDR
jgi:arylsulfatase A-like enzyme